MKASEQSWTEAEARKRFSELLEAAKDSGPQYVKANGGRFVVRYEGDAIRPSAGQLLSKGVPEE